MLINQLLETKNGSTGLFNFLLRLFNLEIAQDFVSFAGLHDWSVANKKISVSDFYTFILQDLLNRKQSIVIANPKKKKVILLDVGQIYQWQNDDNTIEHEWEMDVYNVDTTNILTSRQYLQLHSIKNTISSALDISMQDTLRIWAAKSNTITSQSSRFSNKLYNLYSSEVHRKLKKLIQLNFDYIITEIKRKLRKDYPDKLSQFVNNVPDLYKFSHSTKVQGLTSKARIKWINSFRSSEREFLNKNKSADSSKHRLEFLKNFVETFVKTYTTDNVTESKAPTIDRTAWKEMRNGMVPIPSKVLKDVGSEFRPSNFSSHSLKRLYSEKILKAVLSSVFRHNDFLLLYNVETKNTISLAVANDFNSDKILKTKIVRIQHWVNSKYRKPLIVTSIDTSEVLFDLIQGMLSNIDYENIIYYKAYTHKFSEKFDKSIISYNDMEDFIQSYKPHLITTLIRICRKTAYPERLAYVTKQIKQLDSFSSELYLIWKGVISNLTEKVNDKVLSLNTPKNRIAVLTDFINLYTTELMFQGILDYNLQ